MSGQLVFFLGGLDLEMVTIRQLLQQHASDRFHDAELSWGARASAYAEAIVATWEQDRVPVLIELQDDLKRPESDKRASIRIVDHHGPLAGVDRPTSLEQVFSLLDLPTEQWTRWHELVAANDRGHVRAMQAIGATPDEIRRVRQADRAAQRITPEQEAIGCQAAREAVSHHEGRLTVVQLSHDRTATVTDALEPALGGSGYENLLVVCPHGITFFGEGPAIETLKQRFPGGYYGGELPRRGFWGFPETLETNALISTLACLRRKS